MGLLDRIGNALEGRGRTILYALGGVLLAGLIVIFFIKWSNRKNDEARQALGRAIEISSATVSTGPSLNPNAPTFGTEQDRATRAIQEFEKVSAKYGDPYRAEAQYFIATNRLSVDRAKGISELTELSKTDNPEVVALTKFALAQTKESDGQLDEAATIYADIAKLNQLTVTPETANLRLAKVYEK